MANYSLPVLFGAVTVLLSCTDPQATTADPDATAALMARPVTAAIALGATPVAVDERGVPRLLRAGDAMPAMPAADATTAARMHVERLAPAWGVRGGAMPALEVLGEVPVPGGTVVRMRQVIDGLPIEGAEGGEVRVMVRKDGALVAASGKLIAGDTPHVQTAKFRDDDTAAVARAVSDVYKTSFAPTALAMASLAADGSRLLTGQAGQVNVSLARARKAWFPDGKQLIAAWVVEAYASDTSTTDGDAFRRVIAADDGRVLARTNLKADVAFRYRVFAETTGELHPFDGPIADPSPHATGTPGTVPFPAYVAPNLVTVEGLNHPAGATRPDPWLAANRTETLGNNVDAYTDISAPDGLTFGDFRATVTKAQSTAADMTVIPGEFDRTYDTSLSALSSQGQEMAGITSLFYVINWMHDFWYDGGFTEVAGNGQNSNLGRGGEDRDAIIAEAQDNANGGSRNNANMSTPSDGLPPRMQVFVWSGKEDRALAISNRTPATGSATFGATNFNLTASVVLAEDGTATSSDACEPLTAPATGKIVLADRGACSFKRKALNIQNAGGVGMILANNAASTTPPSMGDDATITTPLTIGALSVLQTEGAAIKAELPAGPVTATMHRVVGAELEGTLDATVVGHEFGHYVHHRLSVCNTTLCGAMSEGWADFSALLLLARAGDNLDGAFPVGVYSTQSFAGDNVYFGIRRAPYSVSPAINTLSFRHMANGEPLPADIPLTGGNPANNAEVHNGGEVWASMLWEGYVALQKAGQAAGASFDDIRLKMRQYVVAGLLMAPPDATPTETRDAILTAVLAASKPDHDILAAAFARRGFGSCAVSPDRNSSDFVGIVESTVVTGRTVAGELTTQRTAACDNDDVLDAGESAKITVPLSNAGPVALADVTATLSSSLPGIHITVPTVSIGKLDAYGQASATFSVALDDTVTTAVASDLSIKISSSNGCGDVTVPVAVRLNTDDVPASSATDTFDAGSSVWAAGGTSDIWSHARKAPLDGLWAGADADGISDASLASPELTAGPGPVTVSFTHRFSFEFAPATNTAPAQAFDGGVIEYTTDGGATWKDVSEISTPGYNQTLTPGTAAQPSSNPLGGRMAFGNTNAAYPDTDTVTLDFGTRLSGQTFKLRFRVGSDTNTGAPGWEIDNVAFTGIAGTPFPTLAPDAGACAGTTTPPGSDGGGCQAAGMGAGNAGAALLVLAVLLRRRRR